MATPKPGEIRCPTCHRSTPPAAFCTQCGSAIPSDARIRPRGMDRDELQDRIRARRVGGEPYRRGAMADEAHSGYERYVPDPADAQAKRAHRPDERRQDAFVDRVAPVVPVPERPVPDEPVPEIPDAPGSLVPPIEPRPDVTREADDWAARAAVPPPPVEPAFPAMDRDEAPPEPEHVDYFDDAAYADEEDAYDYDEWDEARDRRASGAGAFAILGFLALGVLALLGGAVLAGVFSGGPSTGGLNPTLSASPTIEESVAPSVSAAPSITANPSPSAAASGEPVVFPDGFTADTQPCLPGSAGATGCQSNGASNGGVVDIWVGFKNGTESDVIGAALIGPDGSPIGEGSIDLARIGCSPTCPGGWTYFPFRNLSPGTYTVQITRNGEHASETSFEVS